MKVKKVLIFTSESFPYGMAATNRIISYGKGFISNGIETEVICLQRTEYKENIKNKFREGNFDGIKYTYASSSTVKSRYFILRRIHNITSQLLLCLICLKRINRSTLSIYYSSRNISLLIIWLVNKLKKGLLFKEESEHPQVYLHNQNIISRFIFKKIHYKLFDGYLLMTKNLISYFQSTSAIPCIHIPMTVELDRFKSERKKNNSGVNTIVYTGVLSDHKDGINILLEAFARVVKNHSSYRLHLYGNAPSAAVLKKYHQTVDQLKISDLVEFKGKVTREVITEKIMDAKVLVLPRPESLQAQHGFPTKLGEYLATGNPTLVTRVGEIPEYLTDNQDCYMAIPGNVDSLEQKMLEIIEDYPKAQKIGCEGRKIAEIYFNNITQTKKIIETIDNSFK